jgi:hydroxylamine reductase (hybrid-cluster protein)
LSPSRSSTASCAPVEAPEGTAARPMRAVFEHDIDLDGRVAAAVEDLAGVPRPRGRPKKAASDFAESIELANAAVASAKKAARAKIDSATSTAKSKVQGAKDKVQDAKESVSAFDWKGQAEQVKSQATQMARDTATTAKAKTSTAMDGLAKLITDTAQTVDSKLGPQYGDYARQAANAVAGAAKSLDSKDVDQLLGEARDFVRKSPAVAIGAAAIAGYVLMRLARGSSSED